MNDQLFQVCVRGHCDTFQTLYDIDEKILQQTTESLDTPLHLACRSNQKDLVSLILGLQPDMAMKRNKDGECSLHVACRIGEVKLVKLLLDACPCVPYILNKAKESSLSIACQEGHLEVALLLCCKMDFKAWDGIGVSCLHIAVSKGQTDVVRKILGQNLSLASRKDENGFSALHLAAREGNILVIKEILGKDPNVIFLRDCDGRTPLHCAVTREVPVVQELLYGPSSLNSVRVADLINIADNNGDTALHLAAKMTSLEIIELLLRRHGIKVNTANNDGMTVLDILERAHEDANGPIDCHRKRVTIIRQLKAKKVANPTSLIATQQALIVVAGLIVAITYVTGLNPPGGLWQYSDPGNMRNHRPGKAIQSETSPWLFTFFLSFNSLGFIVSLALIPMLMILRKEILFYVNLLVVVALTSIEVAFILGLIMISERKVFYGVEIFLLVLVTLAGIWWMKEKLKLSLIPCRTGSIGS